MRRFALSLTLVLGIVPTLFVACAKAGTTTFQDEPIVGDASLITVAEAEAGALKDSACRDACTDSAHCADGACAPTCTAPLVKCTGSASCTDLANDLHNCGQCGTVCGVPDSGPDSRLDNPDSGILPLDAGADAGRVWASGTSACAQSTCGITCPAQKTLCADSFCWDTQSAHDHCGSCGIACASNEHCNKGKCCGYGMANCGGTCTPVRDNDNNCGACGRACGGSTPFCSGTTCVGGSIYSQNFTYNQIPTTQCDQWNIFRAGLTGTYTSVTISGSNDPVGRTCTGPQANVLCQALHNGSIASVPCNGYTFTVGLCGNSPEITTEGSACQCAQPSYAVRPCLGNVNWGGVATTSCLAPTQRLTVICR